MEQLWLWLVKLDKDRYVEFLEKQELDAIVYISLGRAAIAYGGWGGGLSCPEG